LDCQFVDGGAHFIYTDSRSRRSNPAVAPNVNNDNLPGMNRIDDVADYVILKCTEGGESLNLLKLQKLLYYVQAWHLAFTGKPFFDEQFEAWVHGPVSREIHSRFRGDKTLYSLVSHADIRGGFNPDTALSDDARFHIDSVLEEYAHLSGSQLETLTHREEPWVAARGECNPTERCENVISDKLMAKYYAARIAQ
jgi:uncharacterized phage-associated protein